MWFCRINNDMTFDDSINKILQEAYFNSPYEKATGIKRQVAVQQEDESEFRETKDRKKKALIHAADEVISYWESANEEGEPLSKKELAEWSIQKLAELEERMRGDEYNLDDMKNYFGYENYLKTTRLTILLQDQTI